MPPGASLATVGETLVRAAAEAQDLLLFYYSGHGLLSPRRRELYLSLAGTQRNQLAFTALPFDAVRDAWLDSSASNRVVILDSCFSGRAIGETLADHEQAVLAELEVAGTYTLTSAPANRAAVVLPGERHTAFTERLLNLLQSGSPACGEMITLGDVYRHLNARLRAEGLPPPQQRGTATADLLGLVHNRESANSASGAQRRPGQAALHIAGAEDRTGLMQRSSAPTPDRGTYLNNAEQMALALSGFDPLETKALAEVAEVMFTVDADRAERMASALRIGEYRVRTLARLARQAVATDPARASRLADLAMDRTTRNAPVWEQSWAVLGDFFSVVAALDPARAEQLIDQAERAAKAIDSAPERWRALSELSTSVAAVNPTRADLMVRALADKEWKCRAWAKMAMSVVATDPDRARDLIALAERDLRGRGLRRLRKEGLEWFVAPLIITDPDRTDLQIAHIRVSARHPQLTLAEVAKAVAPLDPDVAEHVADAITGKQWLCQALVDVVKTVTGSDPERASRLAHRAEVAANTITDPIRKAQALGQAAASFAGIDPRRALRLADQIEITADAVANERLAPLVRTYAAAAVAILDLARAERYIAAAEESFLDSPLVALNAPALAYARYAVVETLVAAACRAPATREH